MKKILSLFLCFIMALGAFPVSAFAEETEEKSLEDIIRPQIEAFAKSIDRPNADKTAADALALHGISGKGKKLTVGETHALTATIVNSLAGKTYLTDACVEFAKEMSSLGVKTFFGRGNCFWDSSETTYFCKTYDYPGSLTAETISGLDNIAHVKGSLSAGGRSSYDKSLVWMVGSLGLKITIEPIKVAESTITCNVDVRAKDRFDFDTSKNSGFAGIISGIGALLFREFDWESNFDFQIEFPNECDHTGGNYHWIYDAEEALMNPVAEEGFTFNKTTKIKYVDTKEQISYYYGLDKAVNLEHNRPWVIEYTVKNPNYFLFPQRTETEAPILIFRITAYTICFIRCTRLLIPK